MSLVYSSKLKNIVKMFGNNIHPAQLGRVIERAALYFEYSEASQFPNLDDFENPNEIEFPNFDKLIPEDYNEISLLNVEAVNIPNTAAGVPVDFYTGFANGNNPSARSTVSHSGKLILPFGIRQSGGVIFSQILGDAPAPGELIKVKIQVYRVKI
jgi:hypothetical protein